MFYTVSSSSLTAFSNNLVVIPSHKHEWGSLDTRLRTIIAFSLAQWHNVTACIDTSVPRPCNVPLRSIIHRLLRPTWVPSSKIRGYRNRVGRNTDSAVPPSSLTSSAMLLLHGMYNTTCKRSAACGILLNLSYTLYRVYCKKSREIDRCCICYWEYFCYVYLLHINCYF
jgi:hypothetical protein